jgi:flagellar motor switch protein FliN
VLLDIQMPITAVLGKTEVPFRSLLQLGPGSVLELDQAIGQPAELYVQGIRLATGDVVVVNENYGLRIREVMGAEVKQLDPTLTGKTKKRNLNSERHERNNSTTSKNPPELGKLRLGANANFIFAAGLVAILATLLIPLPTFLLDIGLACSISLAIAVLIIVLGSNEPLELSTFPSLLLITTLFRLSLNVASTRLILLNGNAGTIIDTFGSFVAGGNLIVGLVMF